MLDAAAAPARVLRLGHPDGLQIAVLDHGATWVSATLPLPGSGSPRELLLGCADLGGYLRQRAYLGATIGRFTNRLRHARVCIDGVMHPLLANEGPHQLHGGPEGFDRRRWTVDVHTADRLVLSLVSPDGDQGYPGEVRAQVCYALEDRDCLCIDFQASTTRPCPVGLTHHAYFNLDGDAGQATRSCHGHHLRVQASQWLPTDEAGIPSQPLQPVDGYGLDLRQSRVLRQAIQGDPGLLALGGIDHALALDPALCDGHQPVLELLGSDRRVLMTLATTQPALQIYTGMSLSGVPSRDGGCYSASAGIALEPEALPDSPNHPVALPHWPETVLRPGDTWRATSRLRFAVA